MELLFAIWIATSSGAAGACSDGLCFDGFSEQHCYCYKRPDGQKRCYHAKERCESDAAKEREKR